MAKQSMADLQTLAADGGLKELVLRWFTDTQAPLILQNGNFPDWFQGLAARKEAEDVLRDKALGCFLIRLSDKAIGYILSYKGQDRCRHFVISQNPEGQFVIAGDCQLFGSLTQLIEHYKVRPIQPFGEFLTSSCCQDDADDLYDVVNAKKSSGVSVQALRSIWDQVEPDKRKKVQQRQNESPPAPAPSLPPKSRNRKLTGTVSVDASSLSQALPPVPKRGMPLGFSLSGSLPDTISHPRERPTNPNREPTHRGRTTPPLPANRDSFNPTDSNNSSDFYKEIVPGADLSQVESRSQSLPFLGNNDDEETEEEEKYSNKFNSLSVTASAPPKKVTCLTYSFHAPGVTQSSSGSEPENGSQHQLRSNPLYQSSEATAGSPGRQADSMYAEVPDGPTRTADDTYEQIPGAGAGHSNTYESVKDVKSKKPKSTWGKNNINWKKFFPDNKKK
ncbi:SH2 domain-containing protein 7 [Gambusia affinis]|uniref:SH2 domain-containing protein 7 n=1 Tax=Gambusia affinis TaxID=33528 RepID=UPI001CDC326C|nr:SH2 domain-containing protein 7 [Gambusia affinis]XP_043960468.1 SH2 domain-containing protein 7 [Gambusia affinis]